MHIWAGGGLHGDGVAEGFELPDVGAFDGLGVHVPVVVVRSEVDVVGVLVVQEAPDDDEDRSTDRDESLLLPAAPDQPAVAGSEERVRLAGANGGFADGSGEIPVPAPGGVARLDRYLRGL